MFFSKLLKEYKIYFPFQKMEKIKDRIAIISYPFKSNKKYLILGEIYDNTEKTEKKLIELNNLLSYLYPFYCKYKNKTLLFSNQEDIDKINSLYKLTQPKLIGNFPNKKISFHTPFLFNLTKSKKLFSNVNRPLYSPSNKNRICIVPPISDLILRGTVLSEAVSLSPSFFILLGEKQGKNNDSTATLSYRFLSLCNTPSDKIIKIRENFDILEAIQTAEVLPDFEKSEIYIACTPFEITKIQKNIKQWRNQGELFSKIFYCCPVL